MTEIDKITITGFKGIEYFRSEQNKLNLITGRNNTGKTSFLEAVNLTYNPQRIKNYTNNLGDLVNRKSNSAKIEVLEKSGDKRTLKIRRGSEGDNLQLFTRALVKQIETIGHYRYAEGEGDILQKIREHAKGTFSQVDEEAPKPEETIVVEIENKKYTFYYWGEKQRDYFIKYVDELVDNIIADEEVRDSKQNSINDSEIMTPEDIQTDLKGREKVEKRKRIKERLKEYMKIERFLPLDGYPDPVESSVKMVEDLTTRPDKKGKVENKATKVSEIEQNLSDLNIGKDLVDFNLSENLVFQEDNGKYEVPYAFMGDGFKAVVNILWTLKHQKVDTLLIEEPGVHMHPGYTAKIVQFLIEFIQKEEIQFFITTHSDDFIESFFDENMNERDKSFLEEKFNLIQMSDVAGKSLNYETSQNNLKKQLMDLRGT